MKMLHLGRLGAEELLRPYRGVISYHAETIQHLQSGSCVALRIEASKAIASQEYLVDIFPQLATDS